MVPTMRGRLFGCWDHPQEAGDTTFGSPVARDGRLTLVGWALASQEDEPPEIDIYVDGAVAVSTAPTCYREDIDVIFRHARRPRRCAVRRRRR